MKARCKLVCARVVAWLAVVAAGAVVAADAGQAGVVSLPPMVVEESASLPPWLYVQADGTEYLSRCSESTTRRYVEMRRTRMRWVRSLFQGNMLAHYDTPGVTILVSQRLKPGNNAEVLGDVVRAGEPRAGEAPEEMRRATYAPNMMLQDTDLIGVFSYVDEALFDADRVVVSSDQVRFLLAARQPTPPLWLIDAFMRLYHAVQFDEAPITVARASWHSGEELRRLVRDANGPRTLLSIEEMFTGGDAAATHPEIAQMQSALFVRWALDPRNAQRESFRRFAAAVCEAPASETLLRDCFGFGYADLRDRLSDYLPVAVRDTLVLPLEQPVNQPRLELRLATPLEVSRLRGEWERLAVFHVRKRHVEHFARYLEQARRTLRHAMENGETDPRLRASLGLCELDAGNTAVARELLERASADGANRPRVSYELARMRWIERVKGRPAGQLFTAMEIEPVLQPLRAALDRVPLSREAVELWADVWSATSDAMTAADAERLVSSTKQFISVPATVHRSARALIRHNRVGDAVALLGAGFPFVPDGPMRTQFAQLYAATKAMPRK